MFAGGGAWPVPTRSTRAPSPPRVSISREALRSPSASGANTTSIVQVLPGATSSSSAHVPVSVTTKSPAAGPAKPIEEITNRAVPVFVTMVGWFWPKSAHEGGTAVWPLAHRTLPHPDEAPATGGAI